jgi:2-polyprenyl-3-methyl-5-hydroxy-6-metoxy-1,4-benzoquinol methylase
MAERPNLSGSDFMNSRRLYHGAASYVVGKSVLDFGCGLGHGTYFLHPYTAKIVGYDLHPEVVDQAIELFGSKTLTYTADLDSVKNVDIVVSIEAIEHLEKDDLEEKLLHFSKIAPSIYASTPNGDFFRYQPRTKAERQGRYHVWHYTEEELKALFGKYYAYVWVHGVLRDSNPAVSRFVGYAVYATNTIATPDGFMTDYKIRMER